MRERLGGLEVNDPWNHARSLYWLVFVQRLRRYWTFINLSGSAFTWHFDQTEYLGLFECKQDAVNWIKYRVRMSLSSSPDGTA